MEPNYNEPAGCVIRPIGSAVVGGALVSGIDMAFGRPVTARRFAFCGGAMYVYSLLTCSMEVFSGGRRSAWHNVASSVIFGYVGVQQRVVGIPFVSPAVLRRYPQLSPELVGAAFYGFLTGVILKMLGEPF